MNYEKEIANLNKDATRLLKKYEEKIKEIERLNNIINELEKWLEEQQINSVDLDEWTIIQVRDKILELKGEDKE